MPQALWQRDPGWSRALGSEFSDAHLEVVPAGPAKEHCRRGFAVSVRELCVFGFIAEAGTELNTFLREQKSCPRIFC